MYAYSQCIAAYSQSANLITPVWRNKLAQKMGTTLLQQLRNCDGNVA